MSAKSDFELVKRVQAGDDRAFNLLYENHIHKIRSLARNFVETVEDAEDVAQETFIKAYRALPRFRGQSAFYTWLYRIATNTAKNYIAARARRPQASDLDPHDDSINIEADGLVNQDSPELMFYGEELDRVVKQALNDLPADLKIALTFREYAGLSYEEIAEIMQCPVGTVRSRIFRAREAIDKRVRRAN